MNTIAFRVFNKEEKVMIDIGSSPNLGNYPKDTYEIMLFTGLVDKKNVRIYEGDIVVKHNYSGQVTYEVQWHFNRWWVRNYESSFTAEIQKMDILEVIGNIYENPELLK